MVTHEMLVPLAKSTGVGTTKEGFLNLLRSHNEIRIDAENITFQRRKFPYSVSIAASDETEHTVIHLTVSSKSADTKYRQVIRTIRKTVGQVAGMNIQKLWDGASLEMCSGLYPQIYKTENTMRKLLSKFMLTKLGIGWHKDTVPTEVKDSIRNKARNDTIAILYEVDFSQLSEFLFTQYSILDVRQLPSVLSEMIENEESFSREKIDELSDYIPKSNWDRYFSELLDVTSEKLSKDWKDLYRIRCIVAHNRLITDEDEEKGKELCDSLIGVMQQALDRMDDVEVPDEEKEQASLETVAINSPAARAFKNGYFEFNKNLYDMNLKDGVIRMATVESPLSVSSSLLSSAENGVITLSDPAMRGLSVIESAKHQFLTGESVLTFQNLTPETIFVSSTEHLLSDPSTSKYFVTSGKESIGDLAVGKSGKEHGDDDDQEES